MITHIPIHPCYTNVQMMYAIGVIEKRPTGIAHKSLHVSTHHVANALEQYDLRENTTPH